MKKRLFYVLAIVAILAALTIPFTTPVMAAPVTLTSISIWLTAPYNATGSGTDNQSYAATFTGTGFASLGNTVTGVAFYSWDTGAQVLDTNVTVAGGSIVNIDDTHFTATIFVANGAVHRPLDCIVTTTGGNSNLLYSALIVGDFPTPSIALHDGHAFALIACSDQAGLNEISGPVTENQQIWYKVRLSQPSFLTDPNAANILGGQLAVRFPHNPPVLTYHPAAGYGPTTPGGGGLNVSARDIPEVTIANPFTAMCIDPYYAHAADLDASGYLDAEADYGNTTDDPTQIAGVAEISNPLPVNDTRPSANQMVGSLTVTKVVDRHGAPLAGVTEDFSVQVTGTGGPYNHTFRITDGVLQSTSPYDNPWTINGLSPGVYTVTETTPVDGDWAVSYSNSSQLVLVNSGGSGTKEIDNGLIVGNLSVTKQILWNGLDPSLQTGVSKDFTVTVTGPSYPGGTSHTFRLTSGVLQSTSPYDNPWQLTNLMPGSYTVTETTPGTPWTASGGGGVTVSPGATATSTVTNTYDHGSLDVTKIVAWNGLDPSLQSGVSKDFTVTVTGPSYLSGTSHTFRITSGVLQSTSPYDNPWHLTNLIPGSYTVTETTPGTPWTATGGGSVTVNPDATASSSVTNTYDHGNLDVTKQVLWNGLDPSLQTGVSKDFTITVTGPSYPGGTSHTFRLTSGVLQSTSPYDNPWHLTNLIPGSYTVTETTPGTPWTATGGGGVTVNPDATATSTVTNTYDHGNLQVTKVVNFHGANSSGISQDFTVTVTGPSYPGGTSHTFRVTSGTLINSSGYENPWVLNNLIPGPYTVAETTPGFPWSASGGGGVTVNPDATATSTITNDYAYPGTTLQLPISVVPGQVPPGGGDVLITVRDQNTGTVPLDNPTMDLLITPQGSSGTHVAMNFVSSSDSDNVHLNPGAIWTWTYTYHVTVNTQFQATGSAYYQSTLVTGPLEQAGGAATVAPKVPATSDLGLGILIAGFAGAMIYLMRRRARRA